MAVNQRTSAVLNSNLKAAQLTWELGRAAAQGLSAQSDPEWLQANSPIQFQLKPICPSDMEEKKAKEQLTRKRWVFFFCHWSLGLEYTPAMYKLVAIINIL